MIAIDANILLYGYVKAAPEYLRGSELSGGWLSRWVVLDYPPPFRSRGPSALVVRPPENFAPKSPIPFLYQSGIVLELLKSRNRSKFDPDFQAIPHVDRGGV